LPAGSPKSEVLASEACYWERRLPSERAACLGWTSAVSLPLVARASLLGGQRWPAGPLAWRAHARPGAAVAAWKAALPVTPDNWWSLASRKP
jgi:hypothetical protein